MPKFLFTNCKTFPFKKKSFNGQSERYVKCCIVSVNNPKQVLAIIPLFGYDDITEDIYNYELGKGPFPSYLNKPIEGEFIDVPSKHGPLFRVFTKDEAKYGLCPQENVGKVERTLTGKVKIYNSIKVFTLYGTDNETGKKRILNGWSLDTWYNRFFGFNYHVLSDLIEPLQL